MSARLYSTLGEVTLNSIQERPADLSCQLHPAIHRQQVEFTFSRFSMSTSRQTQPESVRDVLEQGDTESTNQRDPIKGMQRSFSATVGKCATTLTITQPTMKTRARSNTLPVQQISVPATRRVIFPTLYQSMKQSSPLYKHQFRELDSIKEDSPRERALSDVGHKRVLPNPETSVSIAPQNKSLVNNERQQSKVDDSLDLDVLSKNVSKRNSDISDTSKLSSTRRTVLPQLLGKESSLISSSHSITEEINTSPTSITNEIHKHIEPGPSILRNRVSIPYLAPHSQDVAPSNFASANEISEANEDSVHSDEAQETVSLHRSLSESCVSIGSNSQMDDEHANVLTNDHRCGFETPPYSSLHSDNLGDSSRKITRHISHEGINDPREKQIRFDPRVWVHEVQQVATDRCWYNEEDMQRFKKEAIFRIRNWTRKRLANSQSGIIATGTGRIISRDRTPFKINKAFYTNPALSLDAEDEDFPQDTESASVRKTKALVTEIKRVLLVDSYDIFLKLLSRDITAMLPHVEITTAYTVSEALKKIEEARSIHKTSHGFDLIFVEHRLRPPGRGRGRAGEGQARGQTSVMSLSGSNLIQRIAFDTSTKVDHVSNEQMESFPLVIGMTAYLEQDEKKLNDSGCDVIWGKPPPKMDEKMRENLLFKLMEKRGKAEAMTSLLKK